MDFGISLHIDKYKPLHQHTPSLMTKITDFKSNMTHYLLFEPLLNMNLLNQ